MLPTLTNGKWLNINEDKMYVENADKPKVEDKKNTVKDKKGKMFKVCSM